MIIIKLSEFKNLANDVFVFNVSGTCRQIVIADRTLTLSVSSDLVTALLFNIVTNKLSF